MGRRRCPSCDEPAQVGAAYCHRCGSALAPLPNRTLLSAVGWVVVGLLLAFDLLAAISALVPLLVITGPLTWGLAYLLLHRTGARATRWGIAIGVAAMPLFLAYTNRHGPGTYCHPIGTPAYPGEECAEQWDPRPWLAIGIALLAAAPAALIAGRLRGRSARP